MWSKCSCWNENLLAGMSHWDETRQFWEEFTQCFCMWGVTGCGVWVTSSQPCTGAWFLTRWAFRFLFLKLGTSQPRFPKLLVTSEMFGSGVRLESFSWQVQRQSLVCQKGLGARILTFHFSFLSLLSSVVLLGEKQLASDGNCFSLVLHHICPSTSARRQKPAPHQADCLRGAGKGMAAKELLYTPRVLSVLSLHADWHPRHIQSCSVKREYFNNQMARSPSRTQIFQGEMPSYVWKSTSKWMMGYLWKFHGFLRHCYCEDSNTQQLIHFPEILTLR